MAIYVAGKYVHHIWHGGSMVQYMYNGGTQLNAQEFDMHTTVAEGFLLGYYGTIAPTSYHSGIGYGIYTVRTMPFGNFEFGLSGNVPDGVFSRIVVALSPGDGSEQTIFKDYKRSDMTYMGYFAPYTGWQIADTTFFPAVPTNYFVTIYE